MRVTRNFQPSEYHGLEAFLSQVSPHGVTQTEADGSVTVAVESDRLTSLQSVAVGIDVPADPAAVAFFHDHAGWSYNPATETPEEGRQRCAERLAAAEAWAKAAGVSFGWEDDWDVGSHVEEYDAYDQEPSTCEICTVQMQGDVVAALGCIDDADANYRRVVEAELAYEAMPAPVSSDRGSASLVFAGVVAAALGTVLLVVVPALAAAAPAASALA